MAKNKTITEYEARAIAADEAAEHLMSDWTDDQRERSGGKHIVLMLRSEGATYRSHASRLALRKETVGVVRGVISYCLRLRWTGDCAAIFHLAVIPLIASMALGLLLKMPVLAFGPLAILMLLFLGVGLAAHGPFDRPDGIVEAAMQRRAAHKERTNLARAGLTPERYLATFTEGMWIERAKAAHRLGVSSDGKRIL